MRQDMITARTTLEDLLETNEIMEGMYVYAHGKNLVMGREEPTGPDGELQRDDRVRLTCLKASTFGLSVKRHNGRWERAPFSGTLGEVVEAMTTFMQHLVAPY